MLNRFLAKVQSGQSFDVVEAETCLSWVLENDFDDDLFAELLAALANRGETVSEIVGFVNSLIAHTISIDLPRNSIDVCGAGGSGLDRYNVSTTVAFVIAAGGVPVVKQSSGGSKGNGSLDLLQGLGCKIDLDKCFIEDLFGQTQLCFLDAFVLHPLCSKLVPAIKKTLKKKKTILRFLFPLANPVQMDFQLLGTPNPGVARRLAYAIGAMDRKHVLVVTGSPGIDELSISGKSAIFECHNGKVVKSYLVPEELEITEVEYSQIPYGNCCENVNIFLSLISRQEPQSILDMVCLNAGAAFYCYGKVDSIKEGYLLSKYLFKQGLVREKFLQYKSLCPT